MTYRVVLTRDAEADLVRLFDFIVERELDRSGDGDPELADRAIDALRAGFKVLERFPFTCRKVGTDPLLRELVVPFGSSGYVALFEIVDNRTVAIGAVRHQREDDYR